MVNSALDVATPASLLHVEGTVQVGVDDAGHDVQFFGATAGSSFLYDTSADEVRCRLEELNIRFGSAFSQ